MGRRRDAVPPLRERWRLATEKSAINRVDEFLKAHVGEVPGVSGVEASDAVLFERYRKHAVEDVSGLWGFI